jgi:hypothetical protein
MTTIENQAAKTLSRCCGRSTWSGRPRQDGQSNIFANHETSKERRRNESCFQEMH